MKNEGTWVLAEGFNTFLGKIFHDEVKGTRAPEPGTSFKRDTRALCRQMSESVSE